MHYPPWKAENNIPPLFFKKAGDKNVDPFGFRSLGLFTKGKFHIVAKFQRTDLAIYSHSREGKTLSYSQINMVYLFLIRQVSCEIHCSYCMPKLLKC